VATTSEEDLEAQMAFPISMTISVAMPVTMPLQPPWSSESSSDVNSRRCSLSESRIPLSLVDWRDDANVLIMMGNECFGALVKTDEPSSSSCLRLSLLIH